MTVWFYCSVLWAQARVFSFKSKEASIHFTCHYFKKLFFKGRALIVWTLFLASTVCDTSFSMWGEWLKLQSGLSMGLEWGSDRASQTLIQLGWEAAQMLPVQPASRKLVLGWDVLQRKGCSNWDKGNPNFGGEVHLSREESPCLLEKGRGRSVWECWPLATFEMPRYVITLPNWAGKSRDWFSMQRLWDSCNLN